MGYTYRVISNSTGTQDFVKSDPVNLVFVADFYRMTSVIASLPRRGGSRVKKVAVRYTIIFVDGKKMGRDL